MRLTIVLLALAVVIGTLLQRQGPSKQPQFVPVADGVYRLTQWWHLLPGLPFLPVAVGLMHLESGTWVLVDAGFRDGPRQPHATRLLAALRAVIPPSERLAAIALTHGHFDHSGGLPLLMEAYPEVPVLAHAREAPFLQGHADQYMSAFLRVFYGTIGMDFPQPLQVPSSRLQLLQGDSGDLGAWGASGALWALGSGHTPGHTVYLHHGQEVLFAGDAISLLFPSFQLDWGAGSAAPTDSRLIASWKPAASMPRINIRTSPSYICYMPNCKPDAADHTLCVLVGRDLQYRLLVAGHDMAAGVAERARCTAEGLSGSMPHLDCKKYLP